MLKKTKKLIIAALLVLIGGLAVVPAVATAAPIDDACAGLRLADSNANCSKAGADSSFAQIVRSVVDILSIVVGAISVVMIIIGGFKYVISNGDSNGLQGAKNTIIYAIIGLVIVLFAQIIVRFVLVNATQQSSP